MLIDSSVVTELTGITQDGGRSLAFLKKIMKGLLYAELTAGAGTVTGQIRTGDGLAKAGVTNVVARVVGSALLATTTGTEKVGAPGGAIEVWLQTNSSGVFALSVSGTGNVIVEVTVSGGVPMLVALSL